MINLKHDVDRHEQVITEDAIQIAALKSEIETLKEQHGKEIEALQVDIKNLAELLLTLVRHCTVASRYLVRYRT